MSLYNSLGKWQGNRVNSPSIKSSSFCPGIKGGQPSRVATISLRISRKVHFDAGDVSVSEHQPLLPA
jgi:hypothetical protein